MIMLEICLNANKHQQTQHTVNEEEEERVNTISVKKQRNHQQLLEECAKSIKCV